MIEQALTLPCGARIGNRLAKAPMSDGLGRGEFRPVPEHDHLYRAWSDGGAGLVLMGEVQVDRRHAERPGNLAPGGCPRNRSRSERVAQRGDLADRETSMVGAM